MACGRTGIVSVARRLSEMLTAPVGTGHIAALYSFIPEGGRRYFSTKYVSYIVSVLCEMENRFGYLLLYPVALFRLSRCIQIFWA